ncbi:hypothetical protein MRX96_004954 [Rhipicephalus microplus]
MRTRLCIHYTLERRCTTFLVGDKRVSWTLWALLSATLLLQPDTCAASPQSESLLRAMAAAAKPNKDYSFNIDNVYASPATMEKYMNSYSFPGPVDYMSAAAMSPDGGAMEFYPTMTSGSVFDNFAFSPTIKVDELSAYQEPTGHVFKDLSRDKEKKVYRIKGAADEDDTEFDEGRTRPSTTKNGGKAEEWRQPDSKRNSEESRSIEEDGAAATPGRRKRPNGASGSYSRGIPEQDEDSSEEEGGDDAPREDGTSPATSLSGRDEIAYSRGNSRRPFVRVKNSGALTSDEASSSEEGQRAAATPLRNYDTGPRVNGEVRGSTTTANQRLENGLKKNVGNGGYGNSGELPSFVPETSSSRAQGASSFRGSTNGNDNDGVRDVRYNSYNGNNIDDNALRTASGAMFRDNLAATLMTTTTTTTTTARPELGNGLILLNGNGRLDATTTARPELGNGLILLNGNGRLDAAQQQSERSAKSRRRPPLAYTPGSAEYQSESDEGSNSRDQEETTTNGYRSTTAPEPFSYSSEEEPAPPRQESGSSAEEKPRQENRFSPEERPRQEGRFFIEERPRQENRFSAEERPRQESRFSAEERPRQESRFSTQERPRQESRFSAEERPRQESRFSAEERPRQENRFSPEERPRQESRFSAEERPRQENRFSPEERPRQESRFFTEERPRQESRFSAEERIHAMKRPTQTAAARMRRPVNGELGLAAATTPLTNGRGSATANARRSANNGRKLGGYAAAAQMPEQMPAQPPALPPASSLVLLSRDPTPSADQKAAATATTGADQRPAATNVAGGRPRTLFHQQTLTTRRLATRRKVPMAASGGSYSYLDPKGRLQVVRYEADREGGFRVKGSFGQFPGDTKP